MFELNQKWHRFLPLALGVAVLPMNAAFAESFTLDSVDFVTSGNKTNIVLHTGSIVPYQKVLVSDDKLILDIDQVNTESENTVRTNFAGASNITHVIVQPLNEHKMRLIVRGDHLNSPSVAFANAAKTHESASSEIYDDFTSADIAGDMRAVQEENTKPAIMQAEKIAGKTDMATLQDEGMQDAVDLPGAMTMVEEAPVAAAAPAPQEEISSGKDLMQPIAEAPEPEATGIFGGAEKGFFNDLAKGGFGQYAPYGVLAFLLVGLGVFIRRKVQSMGSHGFDDLIEEPKAKKSNGKKQSFREMASDYRTKHGREISAERAFVLDEAIDEEISGNESPIGLRGLGRAPQLPDAQALAKQVIKPSSAIDEMLSASMAQQGLQKSVSRPAAPAPKKLALNNYIKQQAQPAARPQNTAPAAKPVNNAAKAPARSREAADQLMLNEEIKRAQSNQKIVQNRAQQEKRAQASAEPPLKTGRSALLGHTKQNNPAQPPKAEGLNQVLMGNRVGPNEHIIRNKAKKSPNASLPAGMPKPGSRKPSGQGSQLPAGNPEVLDFLRNVADLMEKEGKPNHAKSIQRNIIPM